MKARGLKVRQVLLVAGLGVLVLLIMDFNNRMAELHRLSAQAEQVGGQATALVATQVSLETQIAYATSDAAVEKWAREQARYIRPGDQPIVPLAPPGGTPVPTPVPESFTERVDNWQVWLALFFDRED